MARQEYAVIAPRCVAEGKMESGLMQRLTVRAMHGVSGSVAFAVASFFLLWPFARLDFDRHHDGYMLAQAIAVHQGASVHTDVFAQYGPVTPWLQSLALYLPMGPALALRTVNVAFIAAAAFLLADMGRRMPRGWPVTRAVGWWAAIAWLVLADVWMAVPMLPWSSTVAAMLSVATLYLLGRSLRNAEDGCMRAASITALLGGAVLGLMPFTRINVGLSAVAVCLVVAALIVFWERGTKRTVATLFIFGAALSMLTVVIVLARTASLAEFYRQSIEWPVTWGRNSIDGSHAQGWLRYTLIRQTFPVALACVALCLQFWARSGSSGRPVGRRNANIFTVSAGMIVVIWENLRIRTNAGEESWWKSLASELFFYASSSNNEYLYFFMALAVVVSVVTCATAAYRLLFRLASVSEMTPWLLLGGLALSGLTQSVPTWDPRHLWWAAPIGLLLLFSIVRAISDLHKLSGNLLMLPLVFVTVAGVFSGYTYWGFERVEGRPGTVIEGMLVNRAKFNQINEDTQFLRDHLSDSRSIIYLVDDGDLSVLDGQYRSADSYFVDWGGSPQVDTRILDGDPIVVQTSLFDKAKTNELSRSTKYEVVARNPRLAILMPVGVSAG